MEAALPGRIIRQVDTSNKRLREKIDRRRLQALCGDRFVAARRRAKYLLLDLESGTTLLIHPGASGNLLLREPGVKHDHVVFHLDSERPLVFNDPRRFGMVIVLEEGEADENRYLSGLGPEPLTASFNTLSAGGVQQPQNAHKNADYGRPYRRRRRQYIRERGAFSGRNPSANISGQFDRVRPGRPDARH